MWQNILSTGQNVHLQLSIRHAYAIYVQLRAHIKFLRCTKFENSTKMMSSTTGLYDLVEFSI